MLDAATSTAPGALSVDSSMSVAMTSLSLFTFLLLTPQGWATMYLGLTGFVRAVEAGFDDPLTATWFSRWWMLESFEPSETGGRAKNG